MGKKSHKCVGNFITDAMLILPYLKIYHEKKDIFGKFTMAMRNFCKIYREFTMKNFFLGKITILWEYFSGNRYYGKIPWI
jgi:hypothetical protein